MEPGREVECGGEARWMSELACKKNCLRVHLERLIRIAKEPERPSGMRAADDPGVLTINEDHRSMPNVVVEADCCTKMVQSFHEVAQTEQRHAHRMIRFHLKISIAGRFRHPQAFLRRLAGN